VYYAGFITSSIAAERVFGIMRDAESPKRRSMQFDSWHAEMMFHGNDTIVRQLYDELLHKTGPRKSKAGEQSASSSSSSGGSSANTAFIFGQDED